MDALIPLFRCHTADLSIPDNPPRKTGEGISQDISRPLILLVLLIMAFMNLSIWTMLPSIYTLGGWGMERGLPYWHLSWYLTDFRSLCYAL